MQWPATALLHNKNAFDTLVYCLPMIPTRTIPYKKSIRKNIITQNLYKNIRSNRD